MIDDTLKNSVIVLWLLIRAIRYTLPFSVPYGDVIVMCLSATQILSTWIRCPWEHAPSYWKFLNKHGGDVGPGKAIQLDPLFETSPPISNGCSIIHPGMDCYTHAVKFWIAGLKRAFPVYLPIHLFGLIFSQKRSLTYFLENMIRSTVFLSTYCTSAWLGACIWLNYVKSGVTKKNIYCVLWIPGLAILFERPGRRKELAAYCLTHAFNTIWNYFKQRYGVKSRDWVSTFLLTLSLTVIFQYHQELPKFMTRHLFGIAELHSYLEKYKK